MPAPAPTPSPPPRPAASSPDRRPDSGTGLFGTLSGLVAVLAFLLLSVDVLLELHARSTVTAVAYEAAHQVAVADGDGPDARVAAERNARRALGEVGEEARFTWAGDAHRVTLRVEADRPGQVLAALGLGGRVVDRSVTVRRETLR